VAYRIAPLPMPLDDREGHFCCLKPFLLPYLVERNMKLLTQRVARSLFGIWTNNQQAFK